MASTGPAPTSRRRLDLAVAAVEAVCGLVAAGCLIVTGVQASAASARVVAVMADAGLFAPEVPVPSDLEEAVADAGEPVTVDAVLMALFEVDYWHPGFRPEDHLAALAFHNGDTEQGRDAVPAQIEDLSRLVGDGFAIRLDSVDVQYVNGTERTQIDLTLNGAPHHLDYASHPKRLSTVLHVTVAKAWYAGSTAPDRPRLAWLWTDQGVWLAAFNGEAILRRLNTALARPGAGVWTWVDQEPPLAAGEPPERH